MKKISLIIGAMVLTAMALIFRADIADAAQALRFVNEQPGYTQNYDFFIATTTTATSTNARVAGDGSFKIAGAKKVTFYFSRGGTVQPNTGASIFRLQTSMDGVTWNDFSMLKPAVATSSVMWLQASSTIVAATSTSIMGMNLDGFNFPYVRCIVLETTDGEHTCKASAEF